MNPYIKEIIGEYQSSFMAGRLTVDQTHLIVQMAKKSHKFNNDVYVTVKVMNTVIT